MSISKKILIFMFFFLLVEGGKWKVERDSTYYLSCTHDVFFACRRDIVALCFILAVEPVDGFFE